MAKQTGINISVPTTGRSKKAPTLYIKTAYYLEGAGSYKSSLSKMGSWGECLDGKNMFGYDCAAIEAIHNQANQILSQAGIKLVNPDDCPDKEPCVINSNVPAINSLYYRVGNIDIGVHPKSFRDQLSPSDQMIESVFLTQATLLAQGLDKRFSLPGYQAELFIHVVGSVKKTKVIGLFVPEGYRQKYTNQQIRVAGSPYSSNANRYIILIGYDDIKTLSGVAETIAHEIGHALGLDHYNSNGNLMNSEALGNTNLNPDQINTMRNKVNDFKKYGGGVSSQKNLCVKLN